MRARDEQKAKVESQINHKLSNMPLFMTDFELILAEKVESDFNTRLLYITHTYEFISWLNECKHYKLSNIEDFKQVQAKDVLEWKRSLEIIRHGEQIYPASCATISLKLSAIRQFFKCFEDIIGYNPAANIKNPKDNNEKNKTNLKDDEFDVIFTNLENGVGSKAAKTYQLNHLVKRDKAIISMLACTGIRNDGLVGINLNDIDLNNKTVIVNQKGDKTRTKPLTEEAIFYLNQYLEERNTLDYDTDALFVTNRKKRIDKRTVRELVKKYASGIEKKVTPHVFRKTFGTRVYSETGDIALVAELLDHKDVNTAKNSYVDIDTQRKISALKATNLIGKRSSIVL